MNKGIYELVSDLQFHLSLFIAVVESGKPLEDDRRLADFPMQWIKDAKQALDASRGQSNEVPK